MAGKLKVLVVGCGSIGQRHAELLAERDDVALSVCDSDAKRLSAVRELARARESHARFGAALAQKPDVVFVCTPNHLHERVALAAMKAGADVFCEKPLADSMEAGRAMVKAARRARRVLYVGYVLRYHPLVRRMKEIVDEGGVGTLVSGRAMVGTYFTLQTARTDYRLKEPYALLYDYSHELDLLGFFFGKPRRVVAAQACLGELEIKPEPNVCALIVAFESDAIASAHLDYVQQPQRRSLELYGDKGHLFADFETGELRWYRAGEEGYRSAHFTTGRNDIFRAQLADFLHAVRETREAPSPPGDALAALSMVEAAVKSLERGRWVSVRSRRKRTE